MDFHQIKVFLAVSEELHFGRAAEKLHMAQPPVSRAIAQLEKDLGAKLLERSTRRVELTPAGIEFQNAARTILNDIEDAYNRVESVVGGHRGVIDIVFAGASTHGLVGLLSREMRRSHMEVRANFHSQGFAQDALKRLLRREVDIALGRWDVLPPEVESELVLEEKLVVAVPKSHPLSNLSTVSFSSLSAEAFIELTDTKSVLHDRLLRLAHNAGFEPDTVQNAPDTWTVLALVAAEVGIALTLDSVQRNVQDDHLQFVPVIESTRPIELRMAWLPENRNPALPRVLETARDIWHLNQ